MDGRIGALQSNKFTEEDIKVLVKQFKMDFPAGKVKKPQSLTIVRRVFPRSVTNSSAGLVLRFDADCVMKNVYETFDSANTGRVSNNEILWVFSMAMNGTGGKG
jgi:Ca2+-binding EF-hand superfamily protein